MCVGGGEGEGCRYVPQNVLRLTTVTTFANQSISMYDPILLFILSPPTCPPYLSFLSLLLLAPAQIVCRSTNQLAESTKQKISNFCHVPSENVISVPDCSSIYRVPLLLEQQGVLRFLHKRLSLPDSVSPPSVLLRKWKNLSDR